MRAMIVGGIEVTLSVPVRSILSATRTATVIFRRLPMAPLKVSTERVFSNDVAVVWYPAPCCGELGVTSARCSVASAARAGSKRTALLRFLKPKSARKTCHTFREGLGRRVVQQRVRLAEEDFGMQPVQPISSAGRGVHFREDRPSSIPRGDRCLRFAVAVSGHGAEA